MLPTNSLLESDDFGLGGYRSGGLVRSRLGMDRPIYNQIKKNFNYVQIPRWKLAIIMTYNKEKLKILETNKYIFKKTTKS